ncbi:hypothetical protein AB1Y20_013414 [Prymnesium parvum]|uniref:Protein kinase domain-containing protein n=1 Tax=Prymnesium parvum TaxID=97485 RepID=A0AB34IH77_PRYPA
MCSRSSNTQSDDVLRAAQNGDVHELARLLRNTSNIAARDDVRVCACGWRRKRVAMGAALTPLTPRPPPPLSSPRRQDGRSPLYLVARNGHEVAVRLLLENNADTAARDNHGFSPLHAAAGYGHEDAVRLLLENNADTTARDDVRLCACGWGRERVTMGAALTPLTPRRPPLSSPRRQNGASPLHWAAMNGHEGAVRLLLEKNADTAAKNNVRACACGWRRERVTMGAALTPLTPRRPPLSSPRRQNGASPLHWAAMNGHEGAVRLLLEKNADTAARNNVRVCACGWGRERVTMGAALTPLTPRRPPLSSPRRQNGASPLHWAAMNGHEGAVRVLLEKNADTAAKNNVRACACGWRRERVTMGAALTPLTPRRPPLSSPRRQNGASPLHWAAMNGHEGAVRLLLEKNADTAAKNNDGASPLHCAAGYGHEGAVRLLLENNADTAARDEDGDSPLHCAAGYGHAGAVRLLLEKNADIAARNKVRECACGWGRDRVAMGAALTPLTPRPPPLSSPRRRYAYLPLHAAAYNGHECAVRLLLEKNADIAARGKHGRSPLHWAAWNGHEGAVRLLLENNADTAARDDHGFSPLHAAAGYGHAGAVRLLLENNADTTARDDVRLCACGWRRERVTMGAALTPLTPRRPPLSSPRRQNGASPLHWAAMNGHAGAVRLLLEKNADTAARDDNGASPLHWAAMNGHEGAVRVLLEKNADTAAKNNDGDSPLHCAAGYGHEGAVRLLLESNADTTARDEVRVCACGRGRERVTMGAALTPLTPRRPPLSSPRRQNGASPLHWAAMNGHEGAVRLLLEKNADTAARNNDGDSPLHCAAGYGHEGAVRLLLENNADTAARDEDGRSALDEARRRGHGAVGELLRQAAAAASRPQQALVRQGGIHRAEAQRDGPPAAPPAPPPPAAALKTAEDEAAAEARRLGEEVARERERREAAEGVARQAGEELARERERREAAEEVARRLGEEVAREREGREAAEEVARRVEEELARTQQQLDAAQQAEQRSIAVISIAELRNATDSFSEANQIGQGGFGSVFRTHQPLPSLPHSGPCAVKRLDAGGMQGHAEVHAEIRVLSVCWHEHLLPLVGFCLDATPCLVYPLMAGNLESRVVDPPRDQQRFSWQERVRAIRDATRALVYLHTPLATKSVVLHRDVKPSNILLDAQGNAKLADVGLAREAPELQGGVTHLTTQRLIGSPGFIDPLYTQSGRFSELTDGYAIGVSLLMCLGGRSAVAVVDRFGNALEGSARAATVTDPSAEWPPEVAEQALEIVRGLMWRQTPSRRTRLSEALRLLEDMANAQGLRPGITDGVDDNSSVADEGDHIALEHTFVAINHGARHPTNN